MSEWMVIDAMRDAADPSAKGYKLDDLVTSGAAFFVVKKDNALHAYVNQCPHVGAPLEWIPDQFLDADAQFIQCAVHGAAFVIDDGACAGGPCNGIGLTALPLLQEGDDVKVDVTTVRELLAPPAI